MVCSVPQAHKQKIRVYSRSFADNMPFAFKSALPGERPPLFRRCLALCPRCETTQSCAESIETEQADQFTSRETELKQQGLSPAMLNQTMYLF